MRNIRLLETSETPARLTEEIIEKRKAELEKEREK
jgi:hypothetical protein